MLDVDGMFRVSSLLGDSARMEQAMEQVAGDGRYYRELRNTKAADDKTNKGNSYVGILAKLPNASIVLAFIFFFVSFQKLQSSSCCNGSIEGKSKEPSPWFLFQDRYRLT